MDKLSELNKLIPIPGLMKLISNYLETKQSFHTELLNVTRLIFLDTNHWHTYNDYTICFEDFDERTTWRAGKLYLNKYVYTRNESTNYWFFKALI